MFFELVLSAALAMSAYIWWRAGSLPWVTRWMPAWPRAIALVALGTSYVAARNVEAAGWPLTARGLEFVGAHWIGVLLLLSIAMLVADAVTGFGFFFRRHVRRVRGYALAAGFGLAVFAVVQGTRAPVVRDYQVPLEGLPAERDGTVLVFISDLHLGSLIGERWMTARVEQIAALRPDAVIIGGDILEGDSPSEAGLVPVVARLTAPLGVWAVAGNHEHHGGGSSTLQALGKLGIRVLRDEWRQLTPGLVLAGVEEKRGRVRDDAGPVSSAGSGRPSGGEEPLARVLAGRPDRSATVLVSHRPERVGEAARAGVGLMLAGHTHDGQIWPFRYVVRTQFEYLAGRYDVAGMSLIVCRGTGTFGPRMRLWRPSEIVRITLRAR